MSPAVGYVSRSTLASRLTRLSCKLRHSADNGTPLHLVPNFIPEEALSPFIPTRPPRRKFPIGSLSTGNATVQSFMPNVLASEWLTRAAASARGILCAVRSSPYSVTISTASGDDSLPAARLSTQPKSSPLGKSWLSQMKLRFISCKLFMSQSSLGKWGSLL